MKPSAQITLWGLFLTIAGAVISVSGWSYEASQPYYSSGGGGIAAGLFGAAAALGGLVLVMVGIYRALAKIDALPLPLNAVKNDESERRQGHAHAGDLGEPASGTPAPRL